MNSSVYDPVLYSNYQLAENASFRLFSRNGIWNDRVSSTFKAAVIALMSYNGPATKCPDISLA